MTCFECDESMQRLDHAKYELNNFLQTITFIILLLSIYLIT